MMGKWIEFKVRIEEDCCGSEFKRELLDVSPNVDEDFLDMIYDDYDIEVSDEELRRVLEAKRNIEEKGKLEALEDAIRGIECSFEEGNDDGVIENIEYTRAIINMLKEDKC